MWFKCFIYCLLKVTGFFNRLLAIFPPIQLVHIFLCQYFWLLRFQLTTSMLIASLTKVRQHSLGCGMVTVMFFFLGFITLNPLGLLGAVDSNPPDWLGQSCSSSESEWLWVYLQIIDNLVSQPSQLYFITGNFYCYITYWPSASNGMVELHKSKLVETAMNIAAVIVRVTLKVEVIAQRL